MKDVNIKNTVNTDVKVVEPKVVEPKTLSTEQRLDRLERLVVHALLSIPLDEHTYRQIDVRLLPERATQAALNKRFYQYRVEDNAERAYVLSSILAICADDIAAEQVLIDATEAKRVAAEKELARNAAVEAKRDADEAARVAQETIDTLDK